MFKRHLNSVFSVPSFARLNRVPENDEGSGDLGDSKGGTGGGGAGDEANDEGEKSGKDGKGAKDYVSRADHERALADLNKYKKAAADAARKEKEAETTRLKEQNKWKELAETNEREAKEAREEANKIKGSYVNERKFNAVRSKCEALGLRAEALTDLEMLDLEDIQIETTSTGKINVLGADKFATQLKTRKPHWFAEKKAPSVNTNGARILDSGDAITAKDLLSAEKEGRKSGDLSKYYELHKKFQQQRMAGSRR
jgi:hypothetical protein